jgi:glucose-1-phosphate thymidylyltransferase
VIEGIGLVPAAGRARRIGPLPCSKEIYPVGFVHDANGVYRPRAACEHVLEAIRLGGATRTYVVVAEGKWDIPAYLGDGSLVGMDLAYLTIRRSPSTPTTADRAYPFVRDALVLFGFPDILFEPRDAFARMVARQSESDAEVVLGLFPTNRPEKVDMVDADADGRVRDIVIKPRRTRLRFAWIAAVWSPEFTRFLHEHVASGAKPAERSDEEYVGHVIQAAIASGLHVDTVAFPEGRFHDIGTREDLDAAVRSYALGPRPTAR